MKKIVDLNNFKSWQEGLKNEKITGENAFILCIWWLNQQPDHIEPKAKSHKKGEGNHGEQLHYFRMAYLNFHQKQVNYFPKLAAMDMVNLSSIIDKLLAICGNDYQKALEAWNFIFANWHNLNDFLRNQLSLTAINKYLTEIISKLIKSNKDATNKDLGKWA